MNIVVEGPDNSGKSSLCEYLARRLFMPIIRGSRPGTPAEINKRCELYLRKDSVIIDRHPAVSEMIYGPVLRANCTIDFDLVRRFYLSKPFIIYCRNVRGLKGHQLKPSNADVAHHVLDLSAKHQHICRAYDDWAVEHAQIVYRIGDDMAQVCNLAAAAVAAPDLPFPYPFSQAQLELAL